MRDIILHLNNVYGKHKSKNIHYNNSVSGLNSKEVQAAIDELNSKIPPELKFISEYFNILDENEFNFTLSNEPIINSEAVMVNGLEEDNTCYSITGNILTFVSDFGYRIGDKVKIRYCYFE